MSRYKTPTWQVSWQVNKVQRTGRCLAANGVNWGALMVPVKTCEGGWGVETYAATGRAPGHGGRLTWMHTHLETKGVSITRTHTHTPEDPPPPPNIHTPVNT